MRVPSQTPPGRHEIHVTWDFPKKKVPSRVFTFDVENPDYGKPAPDPDVEALKKQFPGAVVAVFQQGLPCEALGGKAYTGCQDTWINQEDNNNGRSLWLKTGKYQYDNSALIRFDLSALPAAAKVQSAILKLRPTVPAAPQDRLVNRMLRPWEAGTGFNGEIRAELPIENRTNGGQPPKAGESSWFFSRKPERWGANGAAKPGVDREADVLAAGRPVPADVPANDERRAWNAWDISKAAQDWAANPDSNFGLLIRSGGGFCEFYSADYIDPHWRPKLILAYQTE